MIALSAFGVVQAARQLSNNSCSSSGYCLVWQNTGSGGAIEAQSTSVNGLYASSSNGQGVYGKSSSNNGVEGHTSSSKDAGVAGYGPGAGLSGESSGGTAVKAVSDDVATDIFMGTNKANSASCIIDGRANLTCTGKITGKGVVRVEHRNSDGQRVLAYGSESVSPTIEDVGTARMFAGTANVAIDSAFASVMDRNSPYYVFVTPLGNTRGLYVSAKGPSGFQVREIERGRSNLDFDYRIVARPLGAAKSRLPAAPTGADDGSNYAP